MRLSASSFGSPRWFPATILAVSTVVAFALYAPTFGAGFLLDDVLSVTLNRSIRDLTDLRSVLSPDATSTVGGRPFSNLSFALNYAWGGEAPRGYRIANWLLHAANAWLFFALLRSVSRSCPAAPASTAEPDFSRSDTLGAVVASAWLLHPLCSATVAYVSQRTELLMTTCYLACAVLFLRSLSSSRAVVWQAACVGVCLLGMASKEVMVTAPVALLCLDAVCVSGSVPAAFRRRKVFYVCLALTWIPVGLLLRDVGQRAVGFGQGVGVGAYALTECKALALYLAKALWPAPLVFDYGAVFLASEPLSYLWLAVPVAFFIGLILLGRASPRVAIGCSLWLLVLLPTSSVVPVAAQPIAENRAYLPTLIILGLVHALLDRTPRERTLPLAIAVAALLPLGGLSAARLAVMADPLRLWHDTIAKAPLNPRAYANVGELHLGRGEWSRAADYLSQAVALKGDYPEPRANLGIALANLQQWDAAEAQLRAALALAPDRPAFHDNLGNLLLQCGKTEEAKLQFEQALALSPTFPPALNNLAGTFARSGDLKRAAETYARAILADPASTTPRLNLSAVLLADRRLDEARRVLTELLRIHPGHPDGLLALAKACLLMNDPSAAVDFAQKAVAARPDWPEAYLTLAGASFGAGRHSDASQAVQSSLRLRPGWPEAEALRAQLLQDPTR